MTPTERRAKSIEILKEKGVPYFEQLPLLESEESIKQRSAEEIAKRALACFAAIQVACDIAGGNDVSEAWDVFGEFLDDFGIKDELTEKEKAFFNREKIPEMNAAVNMSWKYEAYWSLLWALGIVDEFAYPDDTCDCDFAINAVWSCDAFSDFMEKVKLRSISEILDQTDLFYRYHWACVDARINGREAPASLNPGVVFERRWGLEWLIGKGTEENDYWDDVTLHT